MSREDYYHDPLAPKARSLVPAASAVVLNSEGQVLLIQRSDNLLWSIPGGTMEPGESIATCCIREVREETGISIRIERLTGVYSDPSHVVVYDDGEVRQAFSLCFLAQPTQGSLRPSSESLQVEFVPTKQIHTFNIHPATLIRLNDALSDQDQAFIR